MKRRNGFVVMAKLIGLVKPLAGFMVLAVLMGLAGHLAAAFITIFGGYAVLKLLDFDIAFNMTILFFVLGIFALSRGILRYGEQACNHYIAFKLLALIRDKVFKALRRLCPAKLETKDKGNLISVITSDIELLEVFYAHTISPVLIAFLFSGIMCLFIGRYHWSLGMLALAAYAVVGILIPILISKLGGSDGMKFRTKSGDLSSFVLDSLRGLSETIQYGCGIERLQKMNEQTEALSEDEAKMKRTAGRNMAAANTAVLLADLAMLFLASWLYTKESVDFTGVVVPVLALFSSFGPCMALAGLGSTLQNTFAAGNRVLDILEENPVVEEVNGCPEVSFDGARAKHVSFSYGEENILEDVSVEIAKGKIVGISGKSGSGKSTLLKLFMRFWQAGENMLQISEIDISKINTSNLRAMESFMTQETHLFRDSIKNNLLIAKRDASDEEIIEACKKASIHDFIMSLQKGYETEVGELGDTLSGGERQRLGLARAFLHRAPFMLLDEPTSNLDSLNEAVILKALREEQGKKTIVLVSHRLSTMRIADVLYSVENGRIS